MTRFTTSFELRSNGPSSPHIQSATVHHTNFSPTGLTVLAGQVTLTYKDHLHSCTKSHVLFRCLRLTKGSSLGPCHIYQFHNKASFYGESLLALRPIHNLENHLFSAISNCLFRTFTATPHIWRSFLLPQRQVRPLPWNRDQLSSRIEMERHGLD